MSRIVIAYGHRRSGQRFLNQRRVSRGCIRSFARRIRIASTDPNTRYHYVHTHVNTVFGAMDAKASDIKTQLLQYNQDDCRALKHVVESIGKLVASNVPM